MLDYLRVLFSEFLGLVLVAVAGTVLFLLRRHRPKKRDDAAHRALESIANRVEAELRARAVPFTAVAATWAYGWPKVQIEFATPELEHRATAGGQLGFVSTMVYQALRAEPALGRQATKIDPARTVWLKATGQPGHRHP